MDIPVTQATVFSGRTHCIDTVVLHLLRLDYPHPIDRLWLVNGPLRLDEMVSRTDLPASQYVGDTVYRQVEDTPERRKKKRLAILAGWRQMLAQVKAIGHDVLFVEDDIQVPANALRALQETAYTDGALVASGWTRCNDGGTPAFNFGSSRSLERWPARPVVTSRIDAVGTFCMYLRREVFDMMDTSKYVPAINSRLVNGWGKDIHFCRWLKDNGQRIMVNPDVRCNHWVDRDGLVTIMAENLDLLR